MEVVEEMPEVSPTSGPPGLAPVRSDARTGSDEAFVPNAQHQVVVRTGSRSTSIRQRLSRTLNIFSSGSASGGELAVTPPPAGAPVTRTSSATTATSTSSNDDTSLTRGSVSRSSSNALHSPATPTRTTGTAKFVRRLTRSLSFGSRPRGVTSPARSHAARAGENGHLNLSSTSSTPSRWVKKRPAQRAASSSGIPSPSAPLSPFGVDRTYRRIAVIGEGSYATVYRGYSSRLGVVVALKEITLNPEEGAPFTAIREASLLKGLKHANIIVLHDIIHTPSKLTFVFEYVDTDLSHYMEGYPKGMLKGDALLFLYQLLRGLEYVHARRILHRDLKPQNLLISRRGELKLADFGLARAKSVPSHTYSHEVVTVWYRPPDVLLGSTTYTSSIDLWGVGCIFLEMLSGAPMFPGINDIHDQLMKIFKVLGSPSETSWPGVTRLSQYQGNYGNFCKLKLRYIVTELNDLPGAEHMAERMLRLNPVERLSAREALDHPFFACIPQAIRQLPADVSIYSNNLVRYSGGCTVSFARADEADGMLLSNSPTEGTHDKDRIAS